jgi:hypothetical protein
MPPVSKGRSPFYPGQPVPRELFVGRAPQIQRILERGAGQVALGKPMAIFVEGEYGIGKSSVAGFTLWAAERELGLHGIYAPLGAAETLDDMSAAVMEGTLRSGALDLTRTEKIRNWLARYVGRQTLGGITVNVEALKADAPSVASGFLPFLQEALNRLRETGVRGIFLVLDEINGITANPKFAHFVKGIVDTNALAPKPLPLLLMLCGVAERRREMIQQHRPVERIFDIVEIEALSVQEMRDFFQNAFGSVSMRVNDDGMRLLIEYSAGFPKIMHLVGDAAYWIDQDGVIDRNDAMRAVMTAAEEMGKKYVDQQVYKALKSADYHSILAKIAKMGPDAMNFKKAEVVAGLTETEKRKFNNFLQKMKDLKVLRSGDVQGEYVFTMRMARLYIWLQSLGESETTSS